ncbi:MAG: Spx/MgsR family RNA polymerase-binding regulatory protein [Clostridiaceae bacterium]
MQLIGYKNCGTCKNAKKYLIQKGFDFDYREITENPLTIEEITKVYEKSGIPIQKFLNTSGAVYRELKMKDQMKKLKVEEIIHLLAENPMLIKRPILIHENEIRVGFKEEAWESLHQ